MRIDHIKLNNFRNYKNETVSFGEKVVLVGSNDSGKTNLLYALRLILDDSIPESGLLPSVYDFNFYTQKFKYSITVKFCDITEECIIARLKGHISEDGELFVKLIGTYDNKTGKRDYGLYVGHSAKKMQKIESRYYLRAMNLRYIESSRDLDKYIKKEKNWLLERTKEDRVENECVQDEKDIKEINSCLNCITEKISKLNYVKNSTILVNNNIKSLSSRNTKKEVSFSTVETDSRIMIDRLALSAKENDNIFKLGGDGFSNQTHLSLWACRNAIEKREEHLVNKVTIYCIEEVEAHLHPHHQRILAKFMYDYFKNDQVILTTHSPQIASQFPPQYIVSLCSDTQRTISWGHSKHSFYLSKMIDFGYRMNAISAEMYFADVIILVEGPSEVLFYTALAKELNIDLDYHNISIINISGVGFITYCDIATSLGKELVIRTDKDISKVPRKNKHRYVGLIRSLQISSVFYGDDHFEGTEYSIRDLTWDGGRNDAPVQSQQAAKHAEEALKSNDIFVSKIDLENDLVRDTPFGEQIKAHFFTQQDSTAVEKLQSKKAINMYKLLEKEKKHLKSLSENDIALPLLSAKNLSR